MRGLAGVMTCPECGRVAKNERQLRPRNTRRSALWLGGLIVLVAAALPTGFAVRQRGAAAALPTRVLLWWVSRISSPPDSVMRETLWRMGHTEGTWERAAASHADGLAARMLECPAANIDDYAAMIEALSVSEQRQKDAVASALSPDPVRRLAAMKLLAAAREPIEIDEKLIAGWERDADRRVATAARVVRYSQLSHAIALLSGATAVPLSEQGALRCLRICTSTPAIWVWDLPGLQKYEAHARREVALRATCLVGARELLQTEPSPERLAAMFMAKSELDRAPFGPGPTWASAGSVCVSGRPQLGAALSACVSHRDPRVREVFFRQLSPSAAIPRGASWGAAIVLWQGLLPELERQLGVEDDAAAKVALARLIDEIKGSPPTGQTP